MNISLSAFTPGSVVSRDGFGSPVPHPLETSSIALDTRYSVVSYLMNLMNRVACVDLSVYRTED